MYLVEFKDGVLDREAIVNRYDLPLWQEEFFDLHRILEMGAKKYAVDGWLEPGAPGTSFKEMHASIFRHVAESSAGITKDWESGEHPLLHAAIRCLMEYVLQKRGITVIGQK